MKLFSLLPKHLVHFACNSPRRLSCVPHLRAPPSETRRAEERCDMAISAK